MSIWYLSIRTLDTLHKDVFMYAYLYVCMSQVLWSLFPPPLRTRIHNFALVWFLICCSR